MAANMNSTLVLGFVILFTLIAQGQSCSLPIQATSGTVCSTDPWHITCGSTEERPQIFRDNVQLYNGSVLSPEIATRATVSTPPITSCNYVTIVFRSLAAEDTGNYTCRTSGWESEAVDLVVEEHIGQHSCVIESNTGLFVQAGDDVTLVCRSDTGSPSWIGLETVSNVSVATVNDHQTNLTLTATNSSTILTCIIMSLDSSTCPPINSTCMQSILVVPKPIDQYLLIEPQVETITAGHSAGFTCTTTLMGSRVLVRPTESLTSEQYFIHELSHTSVNITFNNITKNYTDPIVTCILSYNSMSITETFGSIIVLPAREITHTTPPTFTTVLVTENLAQTTSPARKHITTEATITTTEIHYVTGSKGAKETNVTVIMIVSLVAVSVIFILVAVLVALVFRWKARKRGEWTVGLINGRRGDDGEIATICGGLEGRLEWETDNDELAWRRFESTTFWNSLDNLDESAADIDDVRPSHPASATPNGHAFHQPTNDRTIFRVDAVIEHRSDPSSEVVDDSVTIDSKDSDVAKDTGLENKGYMDRDISTKVESRDKQNLMPHKDQIHDVTSDHVILNGHISSFRERRNKGDSNYSDELEYGSMDDDGMNEAELENLKFVDATKFDERASHRDEESGFGPSPESILSEIDDGAINIVAV